jgi:hypothetical protein
MNPLTHLKPIRILSLLIASALVVGALTPQPALGTPSCGVTTTNLLAPVPAGYFADGLLDLMCNELDLYQWYLKTKVKGDSDLYVSHSPFSPERKLGGIPIPVPVWSQ